MKTITVEFTEDELKLIQFFIQHRNCADLYLDFKDSLKTETYVGLKVSDALAAMRDMGKEC